MVAAGASQRQVSLMATSTSNQLSRNPASMKQARPPSASRHQISGLLLWAVLAVRLITLAIFMPATSAQQPKPRQSPEQNAFSLKQRYRRGETLLYQCDVYHAHQAADVDWIFPPSDFDLLPFYFRLPA
jgi:hypothetical protein